MLVAGYLDSGPARFIPRNRLSPKASAVGELVKLCRCCCLNLDCYLLLPSESSFKVNVDPSLSQGGKRDHEDHGSQ